MAIAGCLLVFSAVAQSQTKFWDRVTVRKAYESKTEDDNNAAIVSFTAPRDTTSSFLINGGVGIDLFYIGKKQDYSHAVTGFFVYNRNTLIEKKQKNNKLGLSAGHLFSLKENPATAIFGTSTVQYLHNYIDTTHSLILTSYWHPLFKPANFIPLSGYRLTPHVIGVYVLPELGLEYQNIMEANSKFKKGYDARGYFRLGFNMKIKKKTVFSTEEVKLNMTDSLSNDPVWSKKTAKEVKDYVDQKVPLGTTGEMDKRYWTRLLEFSFNYTGRSSFMTNNSNFEKYIGLFTASASLYPLKNENVSFVVSYNQGANPIDGTPKQNFWLFSLSFKK